MAVKQFQDQWPKATMWIAINKSLFAQMMYGAVNEVTTKIPSAATDYKKRYFNPEFMDKETFKAQAFIMAHEIMHEILLHKVRKGNRIHRVWNYACDIKINNLLVQSGFEKPTVGVFDHKGNSFQGITEEEIYDKILEDGDQGGGDEDGDGSCDGSGGGNPAPGKGKHGIPKDYEPDLIQGEGGEEPSQDDIARIKGRLEQAKDMHGMGSLPQELQDAINNILNPKEMWYEWLRRYFTAKQFSGCDWTAVCRREYIRSGMIAPPFQSDSLGTIVISVDQSGSISAEDLEEFADHVNSILMDCKPTKVVVQYFDTEVHDTEEFTYEDLPLTLRRVCGGGTSFVDPCERAEEYEAVVHIVMTDGMGSFPSDATVPTIWAATFEGLEVPFGEVLYIGTEE